MTAGEPEIEDLVEKEDDVIRNEDTLIRKSIVAPKHDSLNHAVDVAQSSAPGTQLIWSVNLPVVRFPPCLTFVG